MSVLYIRNKNGNFESVPTITGEAEVSTVPDYWQSAVDEAVTAIKAKQETTGIQCVNFAHFSDMHVFDSDNNYCKNIGHITAAVMDACDIPLAVNNGDVMTNDSVNEQYADTYLPACYERAWGYMSPIAKESLMVNPGNHDGAYGSYDTAAGVAAYRFNWPPEKLWQYIHRPQAQDFRRVWGDNGKYFFIDNVPQKTRFVMLNSHDGQYSENEDGTAVWSTMKGCYQQAQLDWLANVALDVPEGWTIVLFSHVPPTAQLPIDYSGVGGYAVIRGIVASYASKSTYSGSYSYNSANGEGEWADASVSVDFTNAKGEIAGWFCGHAHRDAIVSGDLPFPIVTVTCAGNFSYDSENEGSRTLETATETAVDFISIDRANKMVYIRRLGVGAAAEREASYAVETDPFALTASNWTSSVSSAMTINEDSLVIVKGAQGENYATCNHRFARKEGTYSFSVKANGGTENNYIGVIMLAFDADGNALSDTSVYTPNHSFTYNENYQGFIMNTYYAEFTFTLSEAVSYFKLAFAPGAVIDAGDTVTLTDFNLTEP